VILAFSENSTAAPDWLRFVKQKGAAGRAAAKIGFPKVCTASAS
jgi:hypothetical protein